MCRLIALALGVTLILGPTLGCASSRDDSEDRDYTKAQLLLRARAAFEEENRDDLEEEYRAVESEFPLLARYLSFAEAEASMRARAQDERGHHVLVAGRSLFDAVASIDESLLLEAPITKLVECLSRGPRPDRGPGKEGETEQDYLDRCTNPPDRQRVDDD